MDARLDNIVVVLLEPQDDINIGTAVRACKNFGIGDIRLVRPKRANPKAILISAPRSEELISKLQHFDTLDAALADTTLVLATTARERKGAWPAYSPDGAASELLRAAQLGKGALLFGREDSGLPNDALDRCHGTITVPTDPDYSSLNLGQAVLLAAYEVFKAGHNALPDPESAFPVARQEQVERMLGFAELALERIHFFKSGGREHVMRSVRGVMKRAHLDERELAIWFGIFKEIPSFLERQGVSEKDTE